MTRDRALTFGPFRLDSSTESVWRGVEELRLRPKTFAVLRYLAERPGRVVVKDELFEAVWPEVAVGDAALAVCVGEIRKALGDEARTPRFIETVHRRGYRFIGPVQVSARGETVAAPPAGLVGRDRELDLLRAWLERARRGERQIVFVTGEPGIGKTALVEAFLATLPAAGDVWSAGGQCLDHYGAGEAYLPILEALSRLARGPGGDRVASVLGTHAPTWLAQMPALMSAEALAAVQPRILGATRGRMLREMAEAMESLAAERLLVLLLEDLHWSDPSTLDLVAAVARRREPARLLLIGTYRPVDVIVRGHPLRAVTQELVLHGSSDELPLELLGETDVGRYLTTRFGGEIGTRLAPVVQRRTDGLPLFMVNVVDALIRQGLLVETAGRWEVKSGDVEAATAVPENLRQMIEQQLARLPADEQRLLAAASVAGMAFSSAALAAALEDDVEAVEDRCESLARREQFIRPEGVEEWPDGTVAARYRFLHILYEHVLYERLPAARRASLHRRIGEREEAAYRARPGERAAALALHFERGRDALRAVRYRHHAAEHALQRCAYREAVEHLARGRDLLQAVPDERQRPPLELEMQMTLGPALIALHGSGAPEVEAAYLRARELAEAMGDTARLFPALWGLCFVNYSRGRYAVARELGERLLALAEHGSDTEPPMEGHALWAHHALWSILIAMGQPAAALFHIERGQQLYDPERHASQAVVYGHHDAGTCSWYHLACARWLLGHADAALAALREARVLAERLNHPMTTMIALCSTMWVHYHRGDLADTRQCAHDVVTLGTMHGFSGWIDDGAVVLGCLAAGDAADHASIHAAIEALFERIHSGGPGRAAWRNVLCLCALARRATDRGDVEMGVEILDAIPEEQRGAFFAPEIERIRGELLVRRDEGVEAERCFRRALEMARARAERSLELRAATSLARLLARKDNGEARRILGGVYGWFTEGFETADLREARTLLEELKGAGDFWPPFRL
jgi:DNA-binding winged helix-turn-helix (wHTH) protein/tetratricopeptide (TPR) repeat protein